MITHFTQLYAWQKNNELVLYIYKVTKNFPKDELFGLVSQMRRAAVSIIANIAEGYGRFHYKDKINFYIIARGSSAEVQNYLIVSKNLGYLTEKEYNEMRIFSDEGYKLICGLIQSTGKYKSLAV